MKRTLAMYLIFMALTGGFAVADDGMEVSFLKIRGELKTHFRWSEDSRFPLAFPFPPEFIPRGQTEVAMQTVDPGTSLEVSTANVIFDLSFSEEVTGRVRIHFLDLYNRNPTSTDQIVNVKEAWMLFGRKPELLDTFSGTPIYLLFGKAPKFERQPDRNLESYGLVSTAFNRLEDLQVQLGGEAGPAYWRVQYSSGNPVFFRDPNALAGDNGNDDLRLPRPELHLNSGFPILYDAEVEETGFDNPELGAGLGLRWKNEEGDRIFDVLGFYYERDLADRVDLRGTFYGGDLDLLDGSAGISLPLRGRKKTEYGGNVEFHWNQLRLFFQGVHQEMAGLKRDGYEAEVAWRFGLPLWLASGGNQLFTSIQPVVRFSLLDNKFRGPRTFPAPSTFWDWQKIDVGARIGIIKGVDFTAEYSIHEIDAPRPVHLDEFLTTLRLRF